MKGRTAWWVATLVAAPLACTSVPPSQAGTTSPPISDRSRDSVGTGLVPAGFGSLKQDDISIRLQLRGLLVRATPLDESVIRLLASDSYRSLRDRRESERARIASLATRSGVRGFSIWSLSYYGLEPDVRFSPSEVIISSVGRDFRPIDIIPLTSGFGQQRLDQRDTQTALYLFDEAVDVNQPLTMTIEATRSTGWQETLQVIERERALVRSRAGRGGSPGH